MKLSLAIIAKDERAKLIDIISKYAELFDEIVVLYDDEKFNHHGFECEKLTLIKYQWSEWEKTNDKIDFSRKRNEIEKHITGDYYFRLDCDDIILQPERVKDAAQYCMDNDISVWYSFYEYSKDEDGNLNACHYRETIVKMDDNLKWYKTIHENIRAFTQSKFKMYQDVQKSLVISHDTKPDHAHKSLIRNLQYLILEYNEDKEKTDPRTIGYLAKSFMALGEFEKAKFFYEKHIKHSGWDEDRYQSWCYMAEMFKLEHNYKEAIACCNEALQERPDYPDVYLKLHDIYFDMGEWDKAIYFGTMGMKAKAPESMVLVDPSSYTWRPALSMSYCLLQIDEVDTAYAMFQKAKQLAPTVDFVKKNEGLYEDAFYQKKYMEHFLWIFNYMRNKHGKDSAIKFLELVPEDISENDFILDMKKAFYPKKIWGEDEIAIFCPQTPEEWSPKSVEGGIGGSEEAVIHLGKLLVMKGWKVTVYCSCGENEGVYDGVKYIRVNKFNYKDKLNILIGWRYNLAMHEVTARFNIMWLHDKPFEDRVTKDAIKGLDRIIVLSEYHKSLLPDHIPEKKIIVSSNGIDPKQFKKADEIKKTPYRIIWASSYDRGLITILKNWGIIKKAIPKAHIHIFYGWGLYDNYLKAGLVDPDFKREMLELFKQEGVYEHGRIGHKQLIEEYAKSSVWAYPCKYEGEIQCIALTKAIGCGCRIITNDYAIMKERSPNSTTDEKFIEALIAELIMDVNPDWKAIEKYLQDNSWMRVAEQWDKIFSTEMSGIKTVISPRIAWINEQIPEKKKIVDIGSNKGHTFAHRDNKDVTCVDLDKYDIPNFVQADALDLPFEDKKFEYAVLAEILEHVPDPVKALKEAKRVSKKVVVSVPYEHEWTKDLRPFEGIEEAQKREKATDREALARIGNPSAVEFSKKYNYEHLYHIRHFTPETFEKVMIEAGFKNFKVIRIKHNDFVWLGAVA